MKIFNLNDPGWGKNPGDSDSQSNSNDDRKSAKPKDGPPDLDQVWSDLETKIKSFFGNHRRRQPPGQIPPKNNGRFEPSLRFIFKGAIFVVIIAILLWLASGFFIVREGQVGVISKFGKYEKTVLPGFQWRIPYPVESVETVDIAQVRSFSVGYRDNARNKIPAEALMLTEDENIVDLQFDVQYRLKAGLDIDPKTALSPAAEYLFAIVNPDESVRQAAETAMREVVGKQSMNRILYESRTQAAQDVRELMQQILDRYKTGIEVITVAIQNVQPPEQVQAAFEDAIKAGQDNERQKNEGNAYASRVIPEARGYAARMIQDAEGYSAMVIGQAKGRSERFAQIEQQYAAAPAITRERMYITGMEEILSKVSKVMVDTPNQSNPLMLLPIDKYMSSQSVQSAVVASSSNSTLPAAGGSKTVTDSSRLNADNTDAKSTQSNGYIRDTRGLTRDRNSDDFRK